MKKIRIIDLFAGLGGIRLGFEQACLDNNIECECVLTSEIKKHAIETLKKNFNSENIAGDIFKIKNEDIPNFDFLLGGFPCQPFSTSGKRNGFADTRGTLFFEIERILKFHKPKGFILENVEGLVKHDLEHKNDKIGRTLKTIIHNLEELGYKVSWKVLDSVDFGIPQSRKRIFIVGLKNNNVDLEKFEKRKVFLNEVLEKGKKVIDSEMTKKLLSKYKIEELYGKSIKDKRGGNNNIHSWDIDLKGVCSTKQKDLLNKLKYERRKKYWANEIGIEWMDGMPLTFNQIKSFFDVNNLKDLLDDLVFKGYLKFEYPKKIVIEEINGKNITKRSYDTTKEKGYNIVTGNLSFEINKILDPKKIAPTLVATDMDKVFVADLDGLRKLTKVESLRLFGYPDNYNLYDKSEKLSFDLLGNTVVVPVVKDVAKRLLKEYISDLN
jgi:DNA (cytosine-5)-methyltransferase 1